MFFFFSLRNRRAAQPPAERRRRRMLRRSCVCWWWYNEDDVSWSITIHTRQSDVNSLRASFHISIAPPPNISFAIKSSLNHTRIHPSADWAAYRPIGISALSRLGSGIIWTNEGHVIKKKKERNGNNVRQNLFINKQPEVTAQQFFCTYVLQQPKE